MGRGCVSRLGICLVCVCDKSARKQAVRKEHKSAATSTPALRALASATGSELPLLIVELRSVTAALPRLLEVRVLASLLTGSLIVAAAFVTDFRVCVL